MSDYKGVKGGDPRMRPVYHMVKVSFICPECKLPKTKMVRSDKVDREVTRACQDCQNIANAERSQRLERESMERWRKREAEWRSRDQRTAEEKEELLAQYADAPKHECDDCGQTFIIFDPAYPFANDSLSRANNIMTVSFGPDPFKSEIYDDHTPLWLCDQCHQNSAWEV